MFVDGDAKAILNQLEEQGFDGASNWMGAEYSQEEGDDEEGENFEENFEEDIEEDEESPLKDKSLKRKRLVRTKSRVQDDQESGEESFDDQESEEEPLTIKSKKSKEISKNWINLQKIQKNQKKCFF